MEKRPVILFIPKREDIDNLKVGDLALNCFGKWAEVINITYRGISDSGRKYVGFYTSTGPTSSVSGSYMENVLERTVPTCHLYNSAELDKVEAEMRINGERMREIGGYSANI